MTISKHWAVAMIAGLGLMHATAHAGLLGSTLDVNFFDSNGNQITTLAPVTVGAGVEIEDWPSPQNQLALDIDIGDSTIDITNLFENLWMPGLALVFRDSAGQLPAFKASGFSGTIDPGFSVGGVPVGDVLDLLTIDADSISIDFGNLRAPGNGRMSINVAFNGTTPVPEPGTLLLAALALLAGHRTLRRNARA